MTLTEDGLRNHSGHVVRTNAYFKISWVWTIARQRLRHWEQSISIGKQIGSEMEMEICAMCTVLAIQTTSERLLLMELICYFSRSPFPSMLLVFYQYFGILLVVIKNILKCKSNLSK